MPSKQKITIAQAITKNFGEVIILAFDFICFSSSSVYLRPPPRPPAPPGRLPAPAPSPGRFPAPAPPPGLLPVPAPPPGRAPAPPPPGRVPAPPLPGRVPAPAPPPGRAPAPPAAPCPRVVPPYLFAVC